METTFAECGAALFLTALFLSAPCSPAGAGTIDTSAGRVQITEVAGGLTEPWGLAFLPDGRFLVTERNGALTLFSTDGADAVAVKGVPQVFDRGQGGLLDVMIPRDFDRSRTVWLTYAKPGGAGAGTALGRGTLSGDGTELQDFTEVFTAPATRGGVHFGSRVVEALDGTLYLTLGERGQGANAQDVTRPEGKVLHMYPDGNPVNPVDGWVPQAHSIGHRNPQGAALDADGALWVVEHGAQGGDEVNRVERGRNYGWPVIAYGINYNGDPLGIGTAADGMEQPVHYWDPSIAPSGLMIHSGAMFPDWRGDMFTGSLKFDYIARLDPDTSYAEERIDAPETARVRDVREGPDGAIWFLSVGQGAVYRMTPAE
jgi:glucose/arabinose dehydrogenase